MFRHDAGTGVAVAESNDVVIANALGGHNLALTGITSFSNVPLRIWGGIGFVISLMAFLFALYTIVKTLVFGADVPGFPTIVVSIMFFTGIQLLSIGILGEYISRVFIEVKQRPHYLIAEEIDRSPLRNEG